MKDYFSEEILEQKSKRDYFAEEILGEEEQERDYFAEEIVGASPEEKKKPPIIPVDLGARLKEPSKLRWWEKELAALTGFVTFPAQVSEEFGKSIAEGKPREILSKSAEMAKSLGGGIWDWIKVGTGSPTEKFNAIQRIAERIKEAGVIAETPHLLIPAGLARGISARAMKPKLPLPIEELVGLKKAPRTFGPEPPPTLEPLLEQLKPKKKIFGEAEMKLAKRLKAKGVTEKKPTKFRTYEEAQKAIDNRIDELMKEGKTFEQADNAPDVLRMYEVRNKIGGLEYRRGYSEVFQKVNKITESSELTKRILDDAYSIKTGNLAEYFATEYTAKRITMGEAQPSVLRHILDDIAKKEHRVESADVLFTDVSPLTQKGKVDLLKRATIKAKAITGAVEDYVFPKETKRITAKGVTEEAAVARAKELRLEKKRREVAVTEPSIIGLNKAEQNRIRRDLRLDELEPAKRKTWERTLEEAKEGKLDENALTIADEVVKSKRPITDAEHGGMVLKAARLVDEYEARIKDVASYVEKGNVKASQMERTRADVIIDQLDKLTDATRLGRRETARALSIGRMMVNRESYTLAHVTQRAKASKGSKLTPQENARFEKLTTKNSTLEATLKELETKYENVLVEKEKGIAQGVAKREARKAQITKRTATTREKILSDRANVKKQLTEMGFRVNDITGVTTEGAYLVGKLATTYIREGITTLDGVVLKVLADLPQLTKRDVYRSLAMKNHKAQARAKIEVARRVARLKNQARLLIEIENAEKGIFEPRRGRQVQSAAIKSLQKKLRELRSAAYRADIEATRLEKVITTINELQDQLANHHRTLRKGKRIDPPELVLAKKRLKEVRSAMKVEDELVRLNEQLRTGEFEIKPKLEPKVLPPEFERKQVELKRARRQIKTAIEEMAPITARKVFVETISTLRTMKATADMSATLRQGIVLSARRPVKFAKNFVKAVRATFSEHTAERIDNAIRSADHHYLREKAKLELTEFDGRVTYREEMFMARVIEKVPVVGEIVKASNRHMTTFLNLMRVDAFDQFLKKYPNATHAELKAWADWVNIASGRGNLGRATTIANELSLVAFAPRFAASRIQTPYMFFRYIKVPRVRAEIAKDLVTFGALGATALTLADLAGFEVGLDPRNPDWGKIRIGDTRIDVWGGCQQPMRVVARIGLAVTDRVGLTGKELSKREKDIDPIELIGRFAAFKLAPAVTIPVELIKGKTIVGEEVTPIETAVRATVPMVYESIYEAYKLENPLRAGLVGGLEFLGVSVSTYKDSEWRTRLRIRWMLKEKNFEGAYDKRLEWNMENPDKKISLEWFRKQIIGKKP